MSIHESDAALIAIPRKILGAAFISALCAVTALGCLGASNAFALEKSETQRVAEQRAGVLGQGSVIAFELGKYGEEETPETPGEGETPETPEGEGEGEEEGETPETPEGEGGEEGETPETPEGEGEETEEGSTPEDTLKGEEPAPVPEKGWVTGEDGLRRYYDGESATPLTGWLTLPGEGLFYLRPEAAGAVATGRFTVSGASYIADSQGKVAKNAWSVIKGKRYWSGNSGKVLTGWRAIDGKRYYLQPGDGGAAATKWKYLDNAWYWFDPATGAVVTGWIYDDGSWYWANERGVMQTGWIHDGKAWYLMASNGKMRTGWAFDKGTWYYLRPSGAMATGWLWDEGNWYYLQPSGAMATGWSHDGKAWYLMNQKGAMQTGWQRVSGTWYYLAGNGAMQTGWLNDRGTWYLLHDSGAMITGTGWISGRAYTLNSDGSWSDDHGMTNRAQQYSSPSKYLILIDCTRNEFSVFQGWKGHWERLKYWQCSTGRPDLPTVKGVFSAGIKGLSFGSGFTCWYYTQIYGDYLIHSGEYYQGTFVEMDNRMGVNISHGCVRLLLNNAKWVYDNIPSGTTIVTY